MSDAPTFTVPRLRFNATATKSERLTAAVLASPRLLAVVPAEELAEPCNAYAAAQDALKAARELPVAPSPVAEIEADLRAGRPVDPAALVKRLSESTTDDRDLVISVLQPMPLRFQAEIVEIASGYEDLMYEAVAEALTDVLDRADEAFVALDGATSADAALDAGKGAEWTRWKALAREYDAVRREHLSLIRAANSGAFPNGSAALAFAMFGGIDRVIPRFFDILDGKPINMSGDREQLPAWVFETGSADHLLNVVAYRDALAPHVAEPAAVQAALAEARQRVAEGAEPAPGREPGRLAQRHGGEEQAMRNSYVARRARSEGAATGGLVGGRFEMDLSRGV